MSALLRRGFPLASCESWPKWKIPRPAGATNSGSRYQEWDEETGGARRTGPQQPRSQEKGAIGPEILISLDKVKRADDKAYRARMDAEKTFDEAEKLLNTSLAREGCQKAIRSWDLKEKAIRQAEAGMASTKATS